MFRNTKNIKNNLKMITKDQISKQIEKDLRKFLIQELEKNIIVDISLLRYGDYSFSFNDTYFKLKNPYIYATSGFVLSLEIYLYDIITFRKRFLNIPLWKSKKRIINKLGELVLKNYELRKDIVSKKEIDKIMKTIPEEHKEQFLRKIILNEIINKNDKDDI